MAKVLIDQSSNTSGFVDDANTRYNAVALGKQSARDTEAHVHITCRAAGDFTDLLVVCNDNDTTSNSTFKLRVNGGDGNLGVTITSGTTGTYQDTANTDTVAAGDEVAFQTINGGGGSINVEVQSVIFDADSNHVLRYSSLFTQSGASQTEYMGLGGIVDDPTEADAQGKFNTAATLQNLFMNIRANARSSTSVLVVRINGGDGNGTIAVGATTTGLFEDLVNTDSISDDDLVNYDLSTGTGGLSITGYAAIEAVTTNSQIQYIASAENMNAIQDGISRYLALGDIAADATNESRITVLTRLAFRAGNLYVKIPANALTGTAVWGIRKDGVTFTPVSVPGGQTGGFESAEYVTVDVDEKISYIVTTGAGTDIDVTSIGFVADTRTIVQYTKSFAMDAILANRFTKTFEIDALLQGSGFTKTFAIDAILTQSPLLVSPIDAAEETSPVYMVATTTGFDQGGGKKHFEINIDKTSDAFGDLEIDTDSYTSQTNWEYWDGDSWEAMPADGMDSAFFGNDVRYQATLTATNKWWRLRELNLTD